MSLGAAAALLQPSLMVGMLSPSYFQCGKIEVNSTQHLCQGGGGLSLPDSKRKGSSFLRLYDGDAGKIRPTYLGVSSIDLFASRHSEDCSGSLRIWPLVVPRLYGC